VCKLLSSITALLCALLCAGAGAAQDPAIRLELDALLQEGGLLRDELGRLRTPSEKLDSEGTQLDEEGQSLRVGSQALNQEIRAFNAALNDLEKAARAQQAHCPRESEDAALVEACNAEAAEIRAQAQQRDAQRPALGQRQQDLNADIERHNAARQDWAGRKSKHDALVELNRRDLTAWLERMQRFFATDGFRAASIAAGRPAACRPEGLQELAAAPVSATLERVLACLNALVER
jgi:chromosome segregation ATPase